MATYANTFEGGTNGNAVVIGATHSGDPWDVVSLGGATINYSTAAAMDGSMGARLVTTAASQAVYMQKELDPSDRYVLRFKFKTPDSPRVSGTAIGGLRTAAATAAFVGINSAGRLQIYNTSGSGVTGGTVASILAPNTDYRIELATNGVTGAGELAYYLGNSTTLVDPMISVTGQSFGGAQVTRARLGRLVGTAFIGTFDYDSFKAVNLATGLVGPYSSDTVTLAASKSVGVELKESITLTATSSSGSATFTQLAGPAVTLTGTGLTRTFVAPISYTAPVLTFRATNGSATDEVTIQVLRATDGIRLAGVWTPIRRRIVGLP